MLNSKTAFTGFSVDDTDAAKTFYVNVLGLSLEDEKMGLVFRLPGISGGKIFIYEKKDHQPANYTMLNFVVVNITEAVDALMQAGVTCERYDMPGIVQDEKGIAWPPEGGNYGPPIAWFKDPAGNIISVLEDTN